jgi:hypothetical protein
MQVCNTTQPSQHGATVTHVREEEDLLIWQVGRDLQAVGVGCRGEGRARGRSGLNRRYESMLKEALIPCLL